MSDLTPRQQQVLDYIVAHVQEHGYPPTVREIGAHLVIRSTNGVTCHLKALERKGRIRHTPHASRGIALASEREPLARLLARARRMVAVCDGSNPNELDAARELAAALEPFAGVET